MGTYKNSKSKEIHKDRIETDDFIDHTPFRFYSADTSPRVDVYQTENDIIVKAEIPGASKENLDLFINENSVRLVRHSMQDVHSSHINKYKYENYTEGFSRTIPIPIGMKPEQARVVYEDSIVSVTVPKTRSHKVREQQ